jgi:hypothetical protein
VIGSDAIRDSKHAGRYAACKTGACTRALRLSTGVGWTYIQSHCRARVLAVQDGSYPTEVATAMRYERNVRGAMETERVDPSPGALGRPAVFSMESAQKHLAGCW